MESQFLKLKSYCETQNFKGWDPYDGLNSKVFNALPFKKWDIARLVWIQGFKRSPINFRKLLFVPKEYNAKGIGLFLSGYCNLYSIAEKGNTTFGTKVDLLQRINELALLLISMQTKNYAGACWGYNFDWQARRLFLFPKNTPNVITTTFCAVALIQAYEITRELKYLDTALSAAEFVLKDLNRTPHKDGYLFSYSPLNGNNTVFNASLMGSKLLSYYYHYTGNKTYLEAAKKSVIACVNSQEKDGSWVYGLLPVQNWKDSFHSGYNLEALNAYQELTEDFQFNSNIEKGFEYYIANFFESDGTPKYYHNKIYPIDIHCPGQLISTLSKLKKFNENCELADKVLNWTVNNMQANQGYFYYQLKKGISSKISYMRWSNAFMFNAMSTYFLEKIKSI